MTPVAAWSSYVAVGDSLTEGMCDASRMPTGEYRGWADRLAMFLAGARATSGGMRYANLAVRSRVVDDVVTRQIPRALEWGADLISFLAGGNDLVRSSSDPVELAGRVDTAVAEVRSTGADVLLVTMYRPQFRFLTPLAKRADVFNSCLRETAARRGAILLDLWNLPDFTDKSAWAPDRVHLSSRGHRALAYHAVRALGLAGMGPIMGLDELFHADSDSSTERQASSVGTVEWASRHVAPWLIRKAQGRSAGDGRVAKQDGGPVLLGADGLPAWVPINKSEGRTMS